MDLFHGSVQKFSRYLFIFIFCANATLFDHAPVTYPLFLPTSQSMSVIYQSRMSYKRLMKEE